MYVSHICDTRTPQSKLVSLLRWDPPVPQYSSKSAGLYLALEQAVQAVLISSISEELDEVKCNNMKVN